MQSSNADLCDFESKDEVIGKQAIDKSNADFYNLALIDIRLLDIEGTRLLTTMRDAVRRIVKIIVTGYPSRENAKEAVNKGADAYIVKPMLNIQEFVSTLEAHLKTQKEAQRYSDQKVVEYIESRTRIQETEKQITKSQLPDSRYPGRTTRIFGDHPCLNQTHNSCSRVVY